MDRTVVVVMVMQLVLCNTQMYDMSDGNDEGLVCPCDGGAIGQCKEEDANLYPGGPTSGSVFSTDISSSCIDVPDQITVTENSKFNMKVHVPYTESWENMKVVLTKDGTIGWFDWFSISGPIPENGRWMEVSIPLPPTIQTGTYEVQIWDNASNNKISIRYFEITEEDLVVTTSTVFTTDSSPASTTITSTASTTVTSAASTIDSSTASFTITSTASTIDITESTMKSPTVSNTEPTTTMQKTSDSTNVPPDQTTTDPPPRGSKISVWGVILGIVIGITAMCLLFSCWFIAAGWRRRRRENKPDDMVSLPRLEVIHTSDSSTNSSTIGITGKRRTANWVFR